ncbi:MAG: hypothetical protein AB7T27_08135 [Kiritimatiellia bacterium]
MGAGQRLSLLRLFLLSVLYYRARQADTIETSGKCCIDSLAGIGASDNQIFESLNVLIKYRLVRCITAEAANVSSIFVLTPCGGYYLQHLAGTFEYAEACLMDTAIDDADLWGELSNLTERIERQGNIVTRMSLRLERIVRFIGYLQTVETEAISGVSSLQLLALMGRIGDQIRTAATSAECKAKKYYGG